MPKTIEDLEIDPGSWEIGGAVLKGVLLEAAAANKPGLVCHDSPGAHGDMSIMTFMASSAAIAPAFYISAQAGRNHQGEIKQLLNTLRKIGVEFEKELLHSTKNINTQRGLLFSGAVLCAAAGVVSRKAKSRVVHAIFRQVRRITEGLVERELKHLQVDKPKLTAGEQLFLKYGITGIRGEVESGFQTVSEFGMPALMESLERGLALNECLLHTLISIMAGSEDSTIVWRSNMAKLRETQRASLDIIKAGSLFTQAGRSKLKQLDRNMISQGLSPGGSADLVAVTLSAYLIEYGQFPCPIC